MSATDRNSLVPFDQDLKYTIKLKERVKSVRNISAIHTGKNAIIPSSMSYLLGWNYCGAALYLVPGQKSWATTGKEASSRTTIESLFTICKP